MKHTMLILSIISIVLLVMPSQSFLIISASEHIVVPRQQKSPSLQMLKDLKTTGCPATLALNLILICGYMSIILERLTIGMKSPVAYAFINLFTTLMIPIAVYHMATYYDIETEIPIYAPANWNNLTMEEKSTLFRVFMYFIIGKTISVSLINRILVRS